LINFFKNKSNASIDKENNVEKEDEKSIEEKAQINTPEIDSKNLLQQPTPPLLKTESSERKAADSLIVAALMGNSIMRFKAAGANAKRMNAQMSVPVELLTSTKSSFNETTVLSEKMKSLNENEILITEQICMEELNFKQPDSNSETKNKLKQILINKINSANKSNTSNNKTNQNISNLSNATRSANSSKASKCMLTFFNSFIIFI
jgi:hypothetical protein